LDNVKNYIREHAFDLLLGGRGGVALFAEFLDMGNREGQDMERGRCYFNSS